MWLVFHSTTRQILGMHVGIRTKQLAEILLEKLSEDKKKPSFILISSQSTTKSFLGYSIGLSEKNLEKRAILKDLIILLGRDVQD